jgi:hypothetical protein
MIIDKQKEFLPANGYRVIQLACHLEQRKQPTSGWVSLFNGKDLTRWLEVGAAKEVKDGVIHGQGITSQYDYLRTEKTYVDFQLALRFKCEADGNSSVFFYCNFEPSSLR